MYILLTREATLYDSGLSLGRKAAAVMRARPGSVRVQFRMEDDGRVRPSFSVDPEEVKGLDADLIRQVFQTVWAESRDHITARLAGLSQRR